MYQSSIYSIGLPALVLIFLAVTPPTSPAGLAVPWQCGQTFRLSQAHSTGSHRGKGAYGWDFSMPVGTPLVAPADGVVRAVRQDSTRHGCNASYAYDGNYVIIAFDDGTEALLLHLKADSVPVSVGDRVQAGDAVGEVGMSGWTCGAHLHFQIQRTCESWWCQSIPAELANFQSPATGERLTSQNCSSSEQAQNSQFATQTDED